MSSFWVLLPDFSLIILGVCLRRRLLESISFWQGVEKLVYFVLFPALLFAAMAGAKIDWSYLLPLCLAGLLVMSIGFGCAWAGRPLMGLEPIAFASRMQCAYRFNTYIAIAVSGKLYGSAGVALMGALCGAMVPFANIFAISQLARHGQMGVIRELMRNPLVIGTVAGLACNLLGLEVGETVHAVLKRLSDAAVALGLLAVGAALRWGTSGGKTAGAVWLLAVKLLLMPAAAWGIGVLMQLERLGFNILILYAALPTASSAYILAMRMGGDGPGVAWLISASTLLAAVTLTFWLSMLPAV